MKKIKNMKKMVVGSVVSLSVLATSAAHAVYTIPTGATDAFTDVSSAISAFEGAAWPVVTTIVVATVGIKLFKKFAGKAT